MRQTPMDVILFPGDLSYSDGYGKRWDTNAILVEPLFSQRVTSYTVGNHDVFESTENGFAMEYRYPHDHLRKASNSPSEFYYSYQSGVAHVIALNSYARSDPRDLQHQWLKKDLENVNRERTPWLIVFFHAPWYVSNTAHTLEAEPSRAQLEPLFLEHQVDIVFSGHVHAYERTHPIRYNETDSCGVTYITIGDGGNREGPSEKYYICRGK